MASILSVGFCGRTIRRVRSVGSTRPGIGRANNPYFSAELISTVTWPLQPTPANPAASRSVQSLPALFSRIACGILSAFKMECFGKPTGPYFLALLPVPFLADFLADL